MFKRFINYIKNRGLCYTAVSKSKKVTLTVCADIDAARIETPHGDYLVNGLENIISSLSEAYNGAKDNNDEIAMQEIHGIRQDISRILV